MGDFKIAPTGTIDFTKLKEPFSPKDIEWRVQRAGETNGKRWAMVLAYVTNRAIQDRLDEVCQPQNWSNEFAPSPDGGVLCGITINGVTKYDGAENTAVEPVKGGLSSAMKRAAVQWGIGRYLYDLDTMFVELKDGRGKGDGVLTTGVKINDKNLTVHYEVPKLPAFSLPKTEGK